MARNSFTNYLNKFSLLKLNYLAVQSPWYFVFFRVTVIFLQTLITIRFIIFVTVKLEYSTALNSGDYAVNWPKPHHFLIIINILWFFCYWSSLFLCQRTNISPKKRFWFHALAILDDDISDWNKESKSTVIYFFFHILKANLLVGSLFSWCLYIPVLIESESFGQFILISLSGFNGAVAGYCSTSFCVNFSFIFAFYSFNTGLKYERIASRLSGQVSTRSHSSILDTIKDDLVRLLIENHKANYFWTQLNSTIFLLTFIAQIPILYLIFFVPLTTFTKCSMVMLGMLNFLCGQSITLLSGSFVKTKFNECHKQFNRVLINRIDLDLYHKIHLICSAEYLIDRQLFYIFGKFEFNNINYLLVVLEMISLLLLLIANAGSS
uniref:Gustatory receptor n=1 Tax=Tetranychus urticae TaxID=32264 RepID=T1L0Z3_TETUR